MSEKQLSRVRRVCAALPETSEKLSHGEPTFFVRKKVFVMFSNNHHNDGHVAALVPAPIGVQEALIAAEPAKFFRPAYVGVRGWVGLELARVSDSELTQFIQEAWRMIAPKTLVEKAAQGTAVASTVKVGKQAIAQQQDQIKVKLITRAVVAARRKRVEALVQSLPEGEVRVGGGSYSRLEVREKRFGYYLDNHHADGRITINCKTVPGINQDLARDYPDRYYIPMYTGKRGWVGLWIDLTEIDWTEVRDLLVEAYRLTAPKRLLAMLDDAIDD